MKNLKDITLSIFAIIGFISILSSFNNQSETQETHGNPESHVWEFHLNNSSTQGMDAMAFSINKKTGEVRKYESRYSADNKNFGTYIKAYDLNSKDK